MKRHSPWPLAAGVGLVVALLIANALVAYHNTNQLYDDNAEVIHSYDVLDSIQTVLSLMKDAETGQRGFIITGEDRYLEPYTAAVADIEREQDRLRDLVSDNGALTSSALELRDLIRKRLEILTANAELSHAAGLEVARQSILSDLGKTAMDAVRAKVAEMIAIEHRLLQQRETQSIHTHHLATVTNALSALAGMGSVLILGLLFHRHQRSRAEAAETISRQGELLRVTLSSIGDAVICVDTRARVTFLNPVAESLTGWTDAEARGHDLSQIFRIVNETTHAPVESPTERVLREGIVVGLANHTLLIARDGHERPISDSAAPIRDADNNTIGVVLVFRDSTEERRNEHELRQLAAHLSESDRRKGEFLAILAHELRNPLAPISGSIQILRASGGDPDTIASAAGTLERQVAQLVRLVDDLLDLTRINRGRVELRRRAFDLRDAANQAAEAIRFLCDELGHRFDLDLPGQPVWVEGDPERLVQVIGNLLSNACKYAERGGHVTLTLKPDDGHAVILLRDTGIGIAPDQLARIFEMFTQIDTSLERSHGGLGIGLTLVKTLVELHGGTVAARSEGLGHGSEFEVRLPALAAGPAPVPEIAPTTPAPAATISAPRRILVVDDNTDAADSLATLLRLFGHDSTAVYDGSSALRSVVESSPEVVLLDIGMPGRNGYEVAREIRSMPSGDQILLVALTGWGQDDDRRRTREAGFDAHLVKPVDQPALWRLLAEMPIQRS